MPTLASRPKLFQIEPLRPNVEEQLAERFEVSRVFETPDPVAFLTANGKGVPALVTGGHSRLDAAVFDRLPNLQIVSAFGVGYDPIDAVEAARRGIVVTNTPDVLSDEVADLAIGLLISTVRQLPKAERYLRDGSWLEGAFPLTASLRGRRAGIFGLGRIGKAIGRRLAAFDIDVSYCGRQRQPDVSLTYYDSLREMALAVDILVVSAPGGAQTQGAVSAEVLAALGPTGVLINVGRGTVVDEEALAVALHDGTIAAAGLDVFCDEPRVLPDLLSAENAVLLPHVGSGSIHTRDAMGQLLVDNVISWFASGAPLTPVPECRALLANRN